MLCVGVGVTLQVVSADLPQAQQEALETVIGLLAVVLVTYMIVWMRRTRQGHARRSSRARRPPRWPSDRLRRWSSMAFLAVLREGFETAVFLLGGVPGQHNPVLAGAGALIGILIAVGLGYGIYKGGVKLNLAKFFKITGAVLVLIAAGLLATAVHTAHEAGWLNFGQAPRRGPLRDRPTGHAALLAVHRGAGHPAVSHRDRGRSSTCSTPFRC